MSGEFFEIFKTTFLLFNFLITVMFTILWKCLLFCCSYIFRPLRLSHFAHRTAELYSHQSLWFRYCLKRADWLLYLPWLRVLMVITSYNRSMDTQYYVDFKTYTCTLYNTRSKYLYMCRCLNFYNQGINCLTIPVT